MTAGKVDLKRELKRLYAPDPAGPTIVDVPELGFLMIDGRGDPNTSQEYRDALQALFTVSYAVKFAIKRAAGGFDYAVMPLEGLWWVEGGITFPAADKSGWSWTALIAQPDQVTEELVEAAAAKKSREALPALAKLRLERFHEGPAAQILHLGPYTAEGPTIERLLAFIAEQGYRPAGKHHEIYLGDPRRSAPEKLRTVVRQPVATVD